MTRAQRFRTTAPDYGRPNRAIILAAYLHTARRQLRDPATTEIHGRAIAGWILEKGGSTDKALATEYLTRVNRTRK